MSPDPLDDLRPLVIDDPSARRWLIDSPDRQTFVARVTEIATAHGIAVSPSQIEDALVAERRRRWERWV